MYKYLPLLQNENAQKEYYLTDIVEIINCNEIVDIEIHDILQQDQMEMMGVNDQHQLQELNRIIKSPLTLYE